MAEPRGSTDQETAPLLRDPEAEAGENYDGEREPTFLERVSSVVQEPLTPLTKVLLVVALLFLLLSSVFIGLFAGAQHKLKSGGGAGSEVTITATTTATATATSTSIATTTVSVPGPTPSAPPEEKACFSADCILLSANILSSLDTSYDPCENFFDFANGGWLSSHPIPADKGSWGIFNVLAEDNKQVVRKILESGDYSAEFYPEETSDKVLLSKLRSLYQSCLDEDHLNDVGTAPLIRLVETIQNLYRGKTTEVDVAGKDDAQKKRNGLTSAVAFLHSRGIGALFEFDIDGDVAVDPNFMTLWFSQPSLGLPSKEYYEDESIVALYNDVLERLLVTIAEEQEYSEEDLLKAEARPEISEDSQLVSMEDASRTGAQEPSELLLNEVKYKWWPPWPWPPWDGDDDGGDGDDDDHGPEDKYERAERLAKAVVKFERSLANASLDLDILYQDPWATYNPVPLSNLTKTLPQINFEEYFATFAPRNYPEKVIVTYPSYAVSLAHILNTTESDVIEAYLVTRAALATASHLGMQTEAWQAARSLDEELKGIKKGAVGDRSEYCSDQVENALGYATGRYFVNETFAGESREKATNVIQDIIQAFKSSLSHISWMDEESASAAAEKADALRIKVGFPVYPDTRSAASIVNYYNRVKISDDTFFDNLLSADANEQYWKWQKLGKQRNLDEWEMYASMVNAYYNPPGNEIVFPAGILQPPFFSEKWPAYLAYGAFGMVAAHELTHAFDSAGRMYNQEGKLEEWWTNVTSAGFQIKQDCIVKQYSSYTIDDGKGGKIHVNGNLTSGENIGDTGLIQSYRAWLAQYDESKEYLLPGLNYTREQLFFIAFGQVWAQNIKPASAVARVRTDPHSPNRYRVDGTLYNVPEFAKAFNCSADAKLNPPREKQCILWS
ncbi:Metalloprotease [Gloeophyllum trabeum ATCC 11539]|uniref:Metalloprotease n=1 Tax=Gloeophyllum trabeum (strain ATCC 11539 / FP-39264 / Madison 617) TaxID=670483 RepID=S7QGN8_GLOTA|nr:Metalloprotease [Gloeophyllum trabeum ATCC 11539]EPQ58373.1 Metalloprotease [Gloeophyllum trabeum ATCC 11539]